MPGWKSQAGRTESIPNSPPVCRWRDPRHHHSFVQADWHFPSSRNSPLKIQFSLYSVNCFSLSLFFFGHPWGTWKFLARHQIWASAATCTTAVAMRDPQPTVPRWELLKCSHVTCTFKVNLIWWGHRPWLPVCLSWALGWRQMCPSPAPHPSCLLPSCALGLLGPTRSLKLLGFHTVLLSLDFTEDYFLSVLRYNALFFRPHEYINTL